MRIILALIFLSSTVSAQDYRGHTWVLGYSFSDTSKLIDLKFNSDKVSISSFRSDHSMAGPSITTFCDSNGKLLVYSNGCEIYNQQNEVIPNGDDLIAEYDIFGSCAAYDYAGNAHGVLFAPQPCDSSIVHLIYLDQLNENSNLISRKLLRTTVNLSDPHAPFVLEKNVLIHESLYDTGSIFMTKHNNGLDWWICLLQLQSKCFDCFHLSETGFSEPFESCTGPHWSNPNEQALGDGIGPGVFSPDGSIYVRFNFKFGLNIYDFDNRTGKLNHREQIFLKEDDFIGYVGASISPNSQYLYASAKFRLYQFDLFADEIEKTGIIVDTLDTGLSGNHFYLHSQLAPDGKIYIAGFNSPTGLHVIHKPDLQGTACDVEQLGLRFPDGVVHLAGLPNNPWYGDLPELSLCDSMVSVTDPILESQNLQVYPNPVIEYLHIAKTNFSYTNYEIRDFSGKLFLSGLARETGIDVGGLESGVYFISLSDSTQGQVKKFVKI